MCNRLHLRLHLRLLRLRLLSWMKMQNTDALLT